MQNLGDCRHQRFEIKFYKPVSTQMCLMDVAAEHSSRVFLATLHAATSQELSHLSVGPKVTECSICKKLGNIET
jgi:hypothetical protein